MHLTNGVTFEFNDKDILQHLCKDRDYFLHFNRIGTNMQNNYKDRDQNVYLLFFFLIKVMLTKYYQLYLTSVVFFNIDFHIDVN